MPKIKKITTILLVSRILSNPALKIELIFVICSMHSGGKSIKFNTNQEKKGKLPGKPRILIAPLDWGLGHATRCIPIIYEFLRLDCEIWLAGDNAIEQLLKTEFPDLPFLTLKGYHIRYSGSAVSLPGTLLRQFPGMIRSIRTENQWLQNQLKEFQFDAVVSDNRFGLYSPTVPCVFITHQLRIKSFLGNWIESGLQRFNYRYINRFTTCWVPDFSGKSNLAGSLSHPLKKPTPPLHYLDVVSRFKKLQVPEKNRHLVVIISGPEPQRSIFEDQLVNQLVHYNGTVDFIRGLPATDTILPSTNQLHFHNHLPVAELNEAISKAEFVISRSGYSTVMDVVHLQKKSILVPTPGQTEQEYLAHHLMKNRIAFCVDQKNFSLQKALEAAGNFAYRFPETNDRNLKETIKAFVAGLT